MRKINLRSSPVSGLATPSSVAFVLFNPAATKRKSQRRETRLHRAAAASHLKELQ